MKTKQIVERSNYQKEIARGLLSSTHTDNLATERRITFCVLAKSWENEKCNIFSSILKGQLFSLWEEYVTFL